ncbi:MAG: DUF489 family protein [Pseudomonadota bacterium]
MNTQNDIQSPPSPKLTPVQSQALALSALIQCCELVRQLATSGMANEYQVKPLLHSLFQFTVDHSSEIYGDLRLLEQGFNRTFHLFNGQITDIDKDILKYATNLIALADELLRNPNMSNILQLRLNHLTRPTTDEWIELPPNINDIYTDTISKLGHRIQVTGDPQHLKNTLTSSRIRTVLLAGVRAAVLWRQVGGSKITLFLQRSKFKDAIRSLSPIN